MSIGQRQPDIMVIDDTPANLELLEELLSSHGYHVRVFPRGDMALRAAISHPPDLVLLDIIMPNMDGFEVCRKFKSMEESAAIPIIFISALDDTDSKLGAFAEGGVDYISKPFREEEVLARVRTHVRLHSLQRELERTNKQLESFTYSVSHDLRAPVRGITGLTRLLLDQYSTNLSQEGRKLCSVIHDNATDMGRLIDDLLQFSRAGRKELSLSSVDMYDMVGAVIEELQTDGEVACGDVEVRVDDLPSASADPGLIRQVWMNLLSNAFKFSSRREHPIIEVTAEYVDGQPVYHVRDNGAGFDMDHADRLFRVFHRLHSSREFEGTGVGLAIVQQIVSRHGGTVWARSEPDAGSVFSFTLGSEWPRGDPAPQTQTERNSG